MDIFYHIDHGKSYEYLYDIRIYYNKHFTADEIQIPIQITKNSTEILIKFFTEYTLRANTSVEICLTNFISIFTELSIEFMFEELEKLLHLFYKSNVKPDDSYFVYPIRKIAFPPSKIDKPHLKYIKNYEKNIINFRIISFYGYYITLQPKFLNKIFDRKKYEDINYEPKFVDEDEPDLESFIRVYGENDFARKILKYSPYSPAQTIYNYKNDKIVDLLKRFYKISSIDDVKTKEFVHRISSPNGLI